MVGIKIQGRLGNQLFQYAFIRTVSLKLKVLFFLEYPLHHNVLLGKYFILGNPFRLRMAQLIGKAVFKLKLKYKHEEIALNVDQPHLSELGDETVYDGYFQTSYYFETYATQLRKELTLKKKYRKSFLKKFGGTFTKEKTLVIHFRRSDYERFYIPDLDDSDFRLPLEYYTNCIQQIRKISEYKIIIIGDYEDIDLSSLGLDTKFEKNDFIVDFQLLQNADALILSNSSFAWWAAMLNDKKDKVIYAPKFWIGFKQNVEYPKGIMSPQWNWIDTNNKPTSI